MGQASEKNLLALLQHKVQILRLGYILLKSICIDNTENQYYLYQKFSKFLYQTKYFREATDCIITVIGGNEQIISNLCDDIRINQKLKQQETKNITDGQSEGSSIIQGDNEDVEIKFHTTGNAKRNLLLYYKELTEQAKEERNIQYLYFYRSICQFEGKGITVNQEMLFKFL